MTGKQVTQATFDAIVREAIEDFGLSETDALAEAKDQLLAAGVADFSNIVTSISPAVVESHDGIRLLNLLRNAENSLKKRNVLKELALLAFNDSEVCGVAGSHGAVELIGDMLCQALRPEEEKINKELVTDCCEAIRGLCAKNEINRLKFVREEGGLLNALKVALNLAADGCRNVQQELSSKLDEKCVALAVSVLRAIRAVQRNCENVKCRIAAGSSLDDILQILGSARQALGLLETEFPSATLTTEDIANVANVARAACSVLRQILAADDPTAHVSETFNRARVLSGENSAMDSGLRALTNPTPLPHVLYNIITCCEALGKFPDEDFLLADCFGVARLCAVSDEICSILVKLGYIDKIEATLSARADRRAVIKEVLALLKNLSARDQCKTRLSQLIGTVCSTTRQHYTVDRQLLEHFCGYVASLCLRRPDIAWLVAVSEAVDIIVQGMNAFLSEARVLKAGCLALRNICSRNEDARAKVRSFPKAELIIRKAMSSFPAVCDAVAYAALRDMDVLAESEIRRDERYTLPDELSSTTFIR